MVVLGIVIVVIAIFAFLLYWGHKLMEKDIEEERLYQEAFERSKHVHRR